MQQLINVRRLIRHLRQRSSPSESLWDFLLLRWKSAALKHQWLCSIRQKVS